MALGHELESALGLSLVNLDDDVCDPGVPVTDFGGFGVAEGVDLDGGCWTLFEGGLWSDWRS